MSIKEEVRKSIEGLNKSELLKVLQDAGFNAIEGTGQITITNLEIPNFKHKHHLKQKHINKYTKQLQQIESDITARLQDYPNFDGIDFCDVGANGIQIRGHHKQVSDYTYGDQITIDYDFSNYLICIDEFVDMWKESDNPERVERYQKFITEGERWGWD